MNNLKDKYKFLIKFFVLCILFNILFIPFKDGLINIVAYQSYFILNMFVEASYSGSIIYLPNTALEVIGACAGLELVAIYLALVFSISKNIKNILIGIPLSIIVYFGNVLRIVLIGLFGVYYTSEIHIIHDIIGFITAPTLTVMASMIYLNLINKCDTNEKEIK